MFCRVSCVILLLCTLNTRSSVSYSAAPYKNNYRSSLATHQGSYLLNRNRPQNSRTFYDRRQNTVRPLFGGGTPVLVSYKNLCPYEGLSAIPCTVSKQYYYACYKDCMVYAKCDPHQVFDLVTQSCQRNNQTTNYNELPPCQQDGFFASPYNCKDYYNCKYNKHQNVFIQLKLRCAEGQCFNSHTGKCECQSATTTPAPCTTHPCDAVPKVSMTVLGEMDVEISTCDDGNCKPAAPNTQVVEVNGQPLIYMNQLK